MQEILNRVHWVSLIHDKSDKRLLRENLKQNNFNRDNSFRLNFPFSHFYGNNFPGGILCFSCF